MSAPALVLLVEDDLSIARFVDLALEELPVRLVTCSSVEAAMAVLASDCVQLVITDLMLPGESGMDLMRRISTMPLPAPPPRVAVFSAGLTPPVREQLMALGAWRLLSKPASVVELETCVRDALLPTSSQGTPHPPPATLSNMDSAGEPGTAAASAQETHAITTHFAGDAALFVTYRARCLQQFTHDAATGQQAVQAQDWPALRRLAHSLATVLLTLGRPQDSALARQLEDASEALDATTCQQLWPALQSLLTAA